jgi:hypothetical protein
MALIGQRYRATLVYTVISACLSVFQGVQASDAINPVERLLSSGNSRFETIESFRGERYIKESLSPSKMPGGCNRIAPGPLLKWRRTC